MQIRRAELDDCAAIAAIHARTWQATYRGVMPQDYLDGLDPARQRGRLAARPRRHRAPGESTLVADVDGRIVGFATWVRRVTAMPPRRTVTALRSIYVDPNRWDSGAGRALMIASLPALRESGFQQGVLWVLVQNERARRFYEAGGWRADGSAKHEDSFGVEVDEVRYRRVLG